MFWKVTEVGLVRVFWKVAHEGKVTRKERRWGSPGLSEELSME